MFLPLVWDNSCPRLHWHVYYTTCRGTEKIFQGISVDVIHCVCDGWRMVFFMKRKLTSWKLIIIGDDIFVGHFVDAPSQWETTLHCNVVSHGLGVCTKWSLKMKVIYCDVSVVVQRINNGIWCIIIWYNGSTNTSFVVVHFYETKS